MAKNTLDSINKLTALFDRHVFSDIIIETEEDSKTTPYDKTRYLDAVSRIFNIIPKNPCAAVRLLEVKDEQEIILLIAFNQEAAKIKNVQRKVFENLKDLLNTALVHGADEKTIAQLLATTLKHSTAYIKLRDTVFSKLDDLENNALKKAIINWASTVKSSNDEAKIYHSYIQVLTVMKTNKVGKDEDFKKEIYKMIIRPFQDVLKVVETLKIYQKISFKAVRNDDNAHAEVAISACDVESDKEDKYSGYIGISKLSCYLCHTLLDKLDVPFRGTHGIFYGHGWSLPNKLIEHQEFIDQHVKELLSNKLKALKEGTELDKLNSKNKGLILSSVSWLQELDSDNVEIQQLFDYFSGIGDTGDLNQENDLSDDEELESQINFTLTDAEGLISLQALKEVVGVLGESE